MMRPNKLECSQLGITFQSILTFAGNTRSLPEKEASERSSDWVCSGLAPAVNVIKLFSFVTDDEAQ